MTISTKIAKLPNEIVMKILEYCNDGHFFSGQDIANFSEAFPEAENISSCVNSLWKTWTILLGPAQHSDLKYLKYLGKFTEKLTILGQELTTEMTMTETLKSIISSKYKKLLSESKIPSSLSIIRFDSYAYRRM